MHTDYIRNSDGIWLNTEVFREEGRHFSRNGFYCPDPTGSPAWVEYWQEQRRRIMYGYTVSNASITGEHYFYLNFCPINRVEDVNAKRSVKIFDFPDFWDGDYNYFWVREIARKGVLESVLGLDQIAIINSINSLEDPDHKHDKIKQYLDSLKLDVNINKDSYEGGFNLIVGKSRRKGYSYKNASCAVRNYITNPNSLFIFGAYEKRFLHPKGIMTMALNYINFINTHTAFNMPSDEINRADHVKASYIEYKDGRQVVGGFKSEIMSLTFKDNADAARGKDAYEIDFEESGAFGTPGLLTASYRASEDCVKAGEIQTGMIVVFGTSGDLEGGTADYKDMFLNPAKYNMLKFDNTWDTDYKSSVGFFHPANLNMEGYYDEHGNSDKEGAKKVILDARENVIKNGGTSIDIQQMMQERPLTPIEAFSSAKVNLFPTMELRKQLDYITANDLARAKGQPIYLYRDPNTNKVTSEADLGGKLNVIDSFNGVIRDKRGGIIMYEAPIESAAPGSYYIGYDPVVQDDGTSLACIIVFKRSVQGTQSKNVIAAIWVGRNEDNDDNHQIAELLAEFYNSTKIMFENMSQDTKTYFRRKRKLHLLALQPDAVISKSIKNSKVNRVFGCHITRELKSDGEKYIKSWLLEIADYDENGQPILNLNRIYSKRILEELLEYKTVSNDFDAVSALIMCMFQMQENFLVDEKSVIKSNKKLGRMNQFLSAN